jgi:hypothetical protein
MNASGIWTFNTREDENQADTTETKDRQANQPINQVRKRFANYDRAKAIKSEKSYASAARNASTYTRRVVVALTRL